MKRALFIDRDGTIIVEPPSDFQVDSLEKLEFIPGVIGALAKIRRESDLELVMVTNQDGLGTDSFPEKDFWPAHEKMLKVLEGEGVIFDDILIDKTFPHENAPTRKPGTGLLTKYLGGEYDLSRSFVIGDRLTDVQLAANLGARAIYFSKATCDLAAVVSRDWNEIAREVLSVQRRAKIVRDTKETSIRITLDLDGGGRARIDTGLGFFNHMLEQLAFHSRSDLEVSVKGDLHIDEHHTIEDTAIALGEAFHLALMDKRGIERYGFFILPMDEVEAKASIDFSGRPYFVWNAEFKREKVGEVSTEMFYHFFQSFAYASRSTLHMSVYGDIEHHKIEALFKAFARAIRVAIRREEGSSRIPSTKGVL